ncbi:MAG: hypothetical protein HHJ11_06130 [Phycicoccus sp.]|nr:hypothetical protein [Phycicoccus sp.]NMM34283.1 hypothetical protein [Phycicoccus sp.]
MTPSTAHSKSSIRCSAKGCRADAAYGLLWNNPKIHMPDRRKTWLACEEHAESLSDYLSSRGFLKDAVPVSELGAAKATDKAL